MLSTKHLLSRITYLDNQPQEVLTQLLEQLVQHIVEGADDLGISVLAIDGVLDLIDEHLP
ncbi:hypothetical protein [Nocardia terpenica]|nr:hypothetical protein [Nocardia terpenica]NQE89570.1 hypothetical protein [Nocardia terpenica]